jgi:hypothetical protein
MTLPMKDNHTWHAPDGYKILVVEQGLVSFAFPDSWYIHAFDPFDIRDQKPPDETCHLQATIFRAPPGVDWSQLPLIPLMQNVIKDAYKSVLERTPITMHPREDIEIAWLQQKFTDPEEHRPAWSRIAMARGQAVHVLFTFDYWTEDAEKLELVWDEIMNSIMLDRYIADPTRGEILH